MIFKFAAKVHKLPIQTDKIYLYKNTISAFFLCFLGTKIHACSDRFFWVEIFF